MAARRKIELAGTKLKTRRAMSGVGKAFGFSRPGILEGTSQKRVEEKSRAAFSTEKPTIGVKQKYPILMGERDQPSSKAGPGGVDQQFIDRGLQKELGLHRRTERGGPPWRYGWVLSFYTHPGIRREVPVETRVLPELVDYLHALAVGVAPPTDLSRRNDDWVRFHTLGLGGHFGTGKEALKYLKDRHLPWALVEKNIPAYGIKAVG